MSTLKSVVPTLGTVRTTCGGEDVASIQKRS
jgi:hypothetical protein